LFHLIEMASGVASLPLGVESASGNSSLGIVFVPDSRPMVAAKQILAR
jgi:hypothetical protein